MPKTRHRMGDLCLPVGQECRKLSRTTGSSGQSKSTRRALSGVSFQTKHPIVCLVNRSLVNFQRVFFFNQMPEKCM